MKKLIEIEQRLQELKALVEKGEVTADNEKELDALIAERKALLDHQASLRSRFEGINGTPIVTRQENTATDKDKLYRSAFLKTLMRKTLTPEEEVCYRTAITSGSSSGGAALPTTTANMILTSLTQAGIIMSEVTITEIPGLKLPKEDASSDAAWVAEGAGGSTGTDTLTHISFLAHDLIKLIEITAQMDLMSIDAFESWLVQNLSEKMAVALDKAVFYGAGSSSNQPTGIDSTVWVEGTNLITTAANTAITYSETQGLLALTKAAYKRGAKFYMNTKMLYNFVNKILDDVKKPIFVQNPENGNQGLLSGFPVVVYDEIKDDEIFFGNLKRYQVNFSKTPEIAVDKSVGFAKVTTVYRGHALVDGKVLDTKAFAKLKLKT